MFYIYILYSEASDIFYLGSSEDPWRRLEEHNTDIRNTFTSKHRPWMLKAVFEAGKTRSEAVKMENLIKRLKNRTVIEKLCDTNFIPTGRLAQLVRVPHMRD